MKAAQCIFMAGIMVAIGGCGLFSSGSSKITEKNGKLFFVDSIKNLSSDKVDFVLVSGGRDIGELKINNGHFIRTSYQYESALAEGEVKGFKNPESECVGFDQKPKIPTLGPDKEILVLCRALVDHTRAYRTYTSTQQRPFSILANQLFFIEAAVIDGAQYEAYYDVKRKQL